MFPLLDLDSALRRLRGNEPLLHRLLEDFRQQLEGFEALLHARLATRDPQGLEQATHSLKGVAGAVGARRLQAEAGRGEDFLRQGALDAAWEALEGLAGTVRETSLALRATPQSEAPALPDPGPKGDPVALIEALAQQLRTGDPKAEDTWRGLLKALPGPAFEGPRRELGEALDAFDFKGAAAALNDLQEALKNDTEGGA